MSEQNWQEKHVVFYDGECGFCNFWVQWILEKDKKDEFLFASLQSDFGQKFLTERALNSIEFNTLYLWKPNHYYLIKSKAVLKIANLLGGIYKISFIANVFPKQITDSIYDVISKNRKKLANQKCFVPDHNQRKKFIEF